MSQQIIFFKKNLCDYSNTYATVTASEGNEYSGFVQNRSNLSAWITTDSQDSYNTTIEIDLTDENYVTDILLIKHNFKSYTLQYWNGSSYVDFSTAITETNNSADVTFHSFDRVSTSKVLLTITGTMVADDDKYLYQFILTERIGQLAGWPIINNPKHTKNKQISKMLSGKSSISQNIGAFSCELKVKNWSDTNDLSIVEALFSSNDGFLLWLCGGDENQFSSIREGYRLEDIYLMQCQNDYSPEFVKGLYETGLNISLNLLEVIS